MLKVVSNTTPIISLLKIGKLDIIRTIYGKIIVPKAVYNEINAGKNKFYYIDLSALEWIEIKEIENKKSLHFFLDLDAGEAEVIVLASELDADLVIIDETLGRKFAKNIELKVTGTIGVLLKAKELGIVDNITSLIDLLIDNGIWISAKLRQTIINKAKE
jgi:predicted nucleic acid-binding protein